jgi:glycosyltransferase involved in cell wall biosynthesis
MIKILIYIPTYNRPDALNKQLVALVPQIQKYQHQVRIIVRDNCSDNNIISILKQKYSDYGNIIFERNFGNIGGNANIALGYVYAAKDEFLWILGDNDLVSGDAIENLLQVLNLEIDFVVCNFEVSEPRIVNWKWEDGWETPMNWRMGLISDTLFNANTFHSVCDAAFFFHNSSFPHLAVACKAAMKKGAVKFLLLPHNLVHKDILDSIEAPTDYSLAYVGMPLLLQLMPRKAGARFAKNWAKSSAHFLYLNRNKFPAEFIASRSMLITVGGTKVRWYLILGFIGSKMHPLKRSLIEKIKQKISPEYHKILKKWGSFFL